MCDRATSSERCTTDKQIRCAGAPYTQRTWWKKRIEEETVVCMERMKEVHNIGKVNRLNLKLKIVTKKRNEAKRAKIHWIDSECVERERDGKPTYKLSQRINEWATTTHEQRASLTSIRDMLMVSCALWEQRWFVCRYAVFLRSFEGILPLASQPNNQLLNSVLSSSIQTERYVPFKTHFCGLRVVETIHRTAEW